MLEALDVVPNPANGAPECEATLTGADPSCVPWNIWTPGGVTSAATKFIAGFGSEQGVATELVASGSVTGALGGYGVKSPWAKDGVGVAFGAEYRRETLRNDYNLAFQTGDLAGQGGPVSNVSGGYDVKEIFAEARIPFVQDAPAFKDLSRRGPGYRFLELQHRRRHQRLQDQAGDWAVNEDVRIRGRANRTVRAPNVLELFTPNTVGLDGSTDNCAGATPVYTPAQCANTGVSATQYGHIAANPSFQYNGLLGGNPNLKPETATTYSLGVVFTPHSILPGFTASADYYNIKITNVIEGYGADNIIDTCALTGIAAFCNLIHRAAVTGSLWLGTDIVGASTSGYVIDITQNTGFLKTSGIDFTANYHFKLSDLGAGDLGALSLDFLGTWTHDYQVYSGIPGGPILQCVGVFGSTCQGTSTPMGGPLPAWKHKARVTWTTPWDGLELSLAWRYVGPVNVDTGATGCPDCHIEAYNWFDLAAEWRFKRRYTFRAGVDNMFDRDPPIVDSAACGAITCSGNTFPQVYDPLGRYIFVGLTADF